MIQLQLSLNTLIRQLLTGTENNHEETENYIKGLNASFNTMLFFKQKYPTCTIHAVNPQDDILYGLDMKVEIPNSLDPSQSYAIYASVKSRVNPNVSALPLQNDEDFTKIRDEELRKGAKKALQRVHDIGGPNDKLTFVFAPNSIIQD